MKRATLLGRSHNCAVSMYCTVLYSIVQFCASGHGTVVPSSSCNVMESNHFTFLIQIAAEFRLLLVWIVAVRQSGPTLFVSSPRSPQTLTRGAYRLTCMPTRARGLRGAEIQASQACRRLSCSPRPGSGTDMTPHTKPPFQRPSIHQVHILFATCYILQTRHLVTWALRGRTFSRREFFVFMFGSLPDVLRVRPPTRGPRALHRGPTVLVAWMAPEPTETAL